MGRAQQLQAESANYEAHKLNKQTKVAIASAEAFGKMNAKGLGSVNLGNNAKMNPGAIMASIAVGSSIGQNMANAMNNAMQSNQGNVTPPPIPNISYFIVSNGNSTGPFDKNTVVNLIQSNQIKGDTLVWREGLSAWTPVNQVDDFSCFFYSGTTPPSIPQKK